MNIKKPELKVSGFRLSDSYRTGGKIRNLFSCKRHVQAGRTALTALLGELFYRNARSEDRIAYACRPGFLDTYQTCNLLGLSCLTARYSEAPAKSRLG